MSTLQITCDAQLAILDGKNRTYPEKVAAINIMLAAVESALVSSALDDATQSAYLRYVARQALENLRNAIYLRRAAELGVNVHPRTYVVKGAPMALWQIAKDLWGDATRWPELLQGNAIHNPNAVRPGTVLYVLAS
jgi:prophage DNA circulation protein